MSERYKPGRLRQDWIRRLAAGELPRDARQDAIKAQEDFDRQQRVARLDGAPRIVHCSHGVPWLDCRTCSKPRAR